jgi:hypothetical protein
LPAYEDGTQGYSETSTYKIQTLPREITQKEAYKIGEVYPEYRRIKQENRISMSAMLSPVQMDS